MFRPSRKKGGCPTKECMSYFPFHTNTIPDSSNSREAGLTSAQSLMMQFMTVAGAWGDWSPSNQSGLGDGKMLGSFSPSNKARESRHLHMGWAALLYLTQSREIPQRYPQRWFFLVYHRERGRIQMKTRGTIVRRSRPAGACWKKAPPGATLWRVHRSLNSQQMGYFSVSLEAAGTSDCTELTEIWRRSTPTRSHPHHGVTWSQGRQRRWQCLWVCVITESSLGLPRTFRCWFSVFSFISALPPHPPSPSLFSFIPFFFLLFLFPSRVSSPSSSFPLFCGSDK